MSSEQRVIHDIYNPPPAPVPYETPPVEPLRFTTVDLAWLVGSAALLAAGAVRAWFVDATFGLLVTVGGVFVIVESWLSGLAFLKRHPSDRIVSRWLVFAAAVVPWLIGLGLAAALMLGLFYLSD